MERENRPERPARDNRRRRKVCQFCVDKVACIDFKPGDVIVKYVVTIGKAIKPIARGEWVWEENIISAGSKTEG